MKFLKYFLSSIAILVVLLATLLTLVLVHPNGFKQPVSRLLEAQTGLQLKLERAESSLSPFRLDLQQITLHNAANKPLFNADRIVLELMALPTLQAPFFSLNVSAPTVHYHLDEQGNSNWPSGDQTVADTTAPTALLLPGDVSFFNIHIENGLVDIRLPGQQRKIALPRLNLERLEEDKASLDLVTEVDGKRFEWLGSFELVSDRQLAITLDMINPSLDSQFSAAISTRPGLAGSDGNIALTLHNTRVLSELLGIPLPDLPEVSFKTAFSAGDLYRLSDLRLQVGEQVITGRADFSPGQQELTLELGAGTLDIDNLLETLRSTPETDETAEPETTTAEATLDWTALTLLDVDVTLQVDEFQGLGWSGRELNAHIVTRGKQDKPRLAIAASGQRVENAEQEIALDSLSLESELVALALLTDGADADLNIKIVMNQSIEATANGRANLNGIRAQALDFKLDSPQSLPLWQLAGLPYQEAGALNVEGKLRSEETTLMPELAIKLGEQELDLEIRYVSEERPFLAVTARGRNLDTRFTETPADTRTTAAKPGGRLFNDEPLDLALLRQQDAELSLDIQGLTTKVNRVDNIAIIAQLKNGRLTTRESRLQLPDNTITLSVDGDFRNELAKARLELSLDSDDAGKLGLEQAAQIKGGQGKATIKLRAEGQTPKQLATSIEGEIDASFQNMTMANSNLNLVGSDLLSEVIGMLNPFAQSDPVTRIECIAVYFDGKRGNFISDKALHVETNKMKIIGNGYINLGTETLSLNFTPIARKGLGVNLGQLARLVRVHGDIRAPRVGVDAGGLVNSALSTGAAMATGGASLVAQSLLERAMNSGSACDPDKELELEPPPVPEELPTGTPAEGDALPAG